MTVHNTKLVLSNTTRTVITNSRKIATQSMQKNTFTKITLENAMSLSRNSSNLPSGLTSQEHFSILEPYISKSVTV